MLWDGQIIERRKVVPVIEDKRPIHWIDDAYTKPRTGCGIGRNSLPHRIRIVLDWSMVTCKACKRSKGWKAHQRRHDGTRV